MGKKSNFIIIIFKKRRSCISTWQLTWERSVEVGEKTFLFIFNLAKN